MIPTHTVPLPTAACTLLSLQAPKKESAKSSKAAAALFAACASPTHVPPPLAVPFQASKKKSAKSSSKAAALFAALGDNDGGNGGSEPAVVVAEEKKKKKKASKDMENLFAAMEEDGARECAGEVWDGRVERCGERVWGHGRRQSTCVWEAGLGPCEQGTVKCGLGPSSRRFGHQLSTAVV